MILHITHNYPENKEDISGIFIKRLAETVPLKRHIISISSTPVKNSSEITWIYAKGVKGKLFSFNGLFKLLNIIKKIYAKALRFTLIHNVCVIHAHWWFPSGLIALLISKKTNVPYIISIHGSDTKLLFFPLSILANLVFKNARMLIPVSKTLKERITYKNTEIIPMPISKAFFSIKNTSSEKSFLVVSRCTAQKRIHVIIKAFKSLKNYKLTIAGEGPLRKSLEILSRREKINVNFLGNVAPHKIPELMSKNKYLIHAGVNEGFGLSVVEAIAAGQIPIVVKSGAIPWIVGEDYPLLFEKDDIASLNQLLRNIIDNKIDIKKIKEKLNKKVGRFRPQNISKKFISLYNNFQCT